MNAAVVVMLFFPILAVILAVIMAIRGRYDPHN